jgi:predicted amidophosphoribosyltransferase
MDVFCTICWEQSLRWLNQAGELLQEPPPSLQTSAIEVWSLFSWSLLNDSDLRPLIYALKGGGLEPVFLKLAEHFSFERGLERLQAHYQDAVLVMPPSSVSGRARAQNDHAWQWAHALGQIWQIPVWDGFAATGPSKSQKQQSLMERQKRELVATEPLPQQKQIIFVDDVITSGATAFAAWKALLSPKHFQVWTIASRPKLAAS